MIGEAGRGVPVPGARHGRCRGRRGCVVVVAPRAEQVDLPPRSTTAPRPPRLGQRGVNRTYRARRRRERSPSSPSRRRRNVPVATGVPQAVPSSDSSIRYWPIVPFGLPAAGPAAGSAGRLPFVAAFMSIVSVCGERVPSRRCTSCARRSPGCRRARCSPRCSPAVSSWLSATTVHPVRGSTVVRRRGPWWSWGRSSGRWWGRS